MQSISLRVVCAILLAGAALLWALSKWLGPQPALIFGLTVLAVLGGVAAFAVAWRQQKHPREIPRTGDPNFDNEIDRILRDRDRRDG